VRISHISAITLVVGDMARSVKFYSKLGLSLVYGGPEADFTTFQAGEGCINLIHGDPNKGWWGRVVLRVEGVDSLYDRLTEAGLEPEAPPRDAGWGERFFHLRDPDGHELSFAQLLGESVDT